MKKLLTLILPIILLGCQSSPPVNAPTPTPTTLPPLARVVDIADNAIVIPIPIDPPSFNAYINDTGYEELIGELVFGALAEIAPDGTYYPELATEVPTFENGGISSDGLTVTWHLRPGIQWSDGIPFTARDVIFTWQSMLDSGIYAPGFHLITDIEMPDDNTAILHYSEFYPNYKLQFGGEGTGVFPAHQCGATDQMLSWECNLNPVSVGPFVLAEWQRGNRLVFNPNPNYWKPDRPLASQLVFNIEADAETRAKLLTRGQAHLDMWLEEPEISRLENEENIALMASNPPRFILQFITNLSSVGHAEKPNPFLADVRVRQAILAAIDVQTLNDKVFNNRAVPANSELARLGCEVAPTKFNLARAKSLLTEAGWVDQDEDGTRECHGCLYAEEGTPLEFDSYYYAEYGSQLKRAHQKIEVMLFEAGINIHPKEKEGVDLWDTWANNGIEIRGNFNLDLWDDGFFGVEPIDYFYDLYDPRAIPIRQDPEAGLNVSRYKNPALADLFDKLYAPVSDAERLAAYCQLADILRADLPTIPILALPDYYAANRRLQGVAPHIYDTVTWNAEDWFLTPIE